MPTVVVAAKDAAGHDVVEVTITMDDHPFATRLTGEAVPMNPGLHAFHFETKDGTRVDHRVLVREGAKNQAVEIVVGATAASAGPAVQAPSSASATSVPAATSAATATHEGRGVVTSAPPAHDGRGAATRAPPAAHERPGVSAGPWRTLGLVAGGLGAVGLGVGAAFGIKAMGDKNDAHCDTTNACKAGPLSDARGSATISTIGFVAGGALLAGGAALVLLAPRVRGADAAALQIAPAVGASDAGLLVQGAW
jgi:hypothetical protein